MDRAEDLARHVREGKGEHGVVRPSNGKGDRQRELSPEVLLRRRRRHQDSVPGENSARAAALAAAPPPPPPPPPPRSQPQRHRSDTGSRRTNHADRLSPSSPPAKGSDQRRSNPRSTAPVRTAQPSSRKSTEAGSTTRQQTSRAASPPGATGEIGESHGTVRRDNVQGGGLSRVPHSEHPVDRQKGRSPRRHSHYDDESDHDRAVSRRFHGSPERESHRKSYRASRPYDREHPSYERHRSPDHRHSKASRPSASRAPSPTRRSASPEDLISALANNKRKASVLSDHRQRRLPSPSPRHNESEHDLYARREPRPPPDLEDHRRWDKRHSRRRSYSRESEDEEMYGRGGHGRGGYYGYPNQGYYGHQAYGRGYHQPPYPGQHTSPPHGYPPQGYHSYPQTGGYYQQPYQQGYTQHPRVPPPPHDHARPGHARTGPPPGAQKTKGGHFANLSWTPNAGAKKAESASSLKSASPAPAAPQSNKDEEEDNPFRPPKDFRAEDEAAKKKKEEQQNGRKPVSFTIKGAADKKEEQRTQAAAPVRMVKELVIRKRMKPRPELEPEHVRSESVYYRKDGNESVVGSGTYGKVYKAIHVYTKNLVALKKIRMDGERDGFPVTAIREIKLLQSLHHPNIVALQETMVEKNDCFMIFEYLSHDLTGLLNHPSFDLSAAHKKDLAKQLFEGLDYLHRRGVLHRDIKAANILVSKTGQLKVADFGLARFYAKHRKQDYTNRVITIWYRSPELLLGETQYGPAVDIWSAACVLVEIFTKHAIFPGDGGEINQLDKIYNVLGTPSKSVWPGIVDLQWHELLRPQQKLNSTFAEKYRDRVTPEAFGLLEAMFQFDPELRPTSSDVLEHPYFTVEEPKPRRPTELEGLDGDWHEFESKALRKERDREARRVEKERKEKEKSAGEKRPADGEESESKRPKVDETA